jgi:hypothetical protein
MWSDMHLPLWALLPALFRFYSIFYSVQFTFIFTTWFENVLFYLNMLYTKLVIYALGKCRSFCACMLLSFYLSLYLDRVKYHILLYLPIHKKLLFQPACRNWTINVDKSH